MQLISSQIKKKKKGINEGEGSCLKFHILQTRFGLKISTTADGLPRGCEPHSKDQPSGVWIERFGWPMKPSRSQTTISTATRCPFDNPLLPSRQAMPVVLTPQPTCAMNSKLQGLPKIFPLLEEQEPGAKKKGAIVPMPKKNESAHYINHTCEIRWLTLSLYFWCKSAIGIVYAAVGPCGPCL